MRRFELLLNGVLSGYFKNPDSLQQRDLVFESRGSDLKKRIKQAFKDGGLLGIAQEFNCDIDKAVWYLRQLGGHQYGEAGVSDKVLMKVRAPRNLVKLMRHFKVSSSVISKIISFYSKNLATIRSHQAGFRDDVVLKQLVAGERLAGLVTMPKDELENLGFIATLYSDVNNYYVCYPENQDVVDEILKFEDNELVEGILRGLAFGYPMADVFRFVRSNYQDVVDSICGHVDDLPRN